MKRFRFHLEPVLEIRLDAEQKAEIRLGEVTSEMNRIRREIRSAEEAGRTAALQRRTDSMEAWAAAEAYTRRMAAVSQNLTAELEPLERARQQALAEYREARRQREILTKLKERQEAAFHREQLKAEQKVIDDLNGGRYARRLQGREGE